ncbi:MAG TPA: isoprenylcysteine carboxylmethyltransferase family protein [Burkholderiaceae bacterium]|nr:isoprenylcysteine carboxylmethyltransferase family protein [Burkholderiaceae bacterium]
MDRDTGRAEAPRSPPPSATSGATAFCGLAALVGALAWMRIGHPFDNTALAAVVVMACTAAGVFIPDLVAFRVQRRALLPRPVAQAPWDGPRILTKFAGLAASVGFVGLLYAVFPEYHADATFYREYWSVVGPGSLLWPAWLVVAVPYIAWVDRRMARPHDGLHATGRLVTLRWRGLEWRAVGQHLLGWLVKGYFLPLMFTYFCNDLRRLLAYDLAHLDTFGALYDFAYFGMYLLDVAFVSMTYVASLRAADTHIRSSEPTLLGWVVALACYQPFWSLVGRQYLQYEGGRAWGSWLGPLPWLYGAWGASILLLLVIYVWATVSFGARFSNLTHRGIITNGPYRYSKHPAYLAKNLSWWLISMPFMVDVSLAETARRCAALLLLNGIYYLRAKTEERHLSLDPLYVDYARWIERRGVLRFVDRVPLLRALARWKLDDRALRDRGPIAPEAYLAGEP